ncbi:hypothetical protein BH09PAT2_BH09PAT2_08410 [soil metagenome]
MNSSLLLSILRRNLLFIFFLLALSVGIYLNSLGNDFAVVDDLKGYIENENIRHLWPSIKTLHIQNIFYALTYQLFGITPLPLRIVAIINHAIVSILVFITIYKLFNKKTAYIASILFAVHPVNSEVIDWVSAQFYAPMAIFQFSAILSHIAYRQTKNKKHLYLTIAIFTLYLILFQHPWVLTTPLVIMVIDFFILDRGFDIAFYKRFLLLLLPILAIYFIIRFPQTYSDRMSGQSIENGKILLNEQAIIPIIEGYPYSVYNTFRLYIFPKDLSIYYDGKPLTSIDRMLMFITFIIYIAGTIYAYSKNKKIAGLLILLVICIAPVFSPIKVTWYITERYLYAGAGFFTTLLSLLFLYLEKKLSIKYLSYILALITVIIFCIRTWERTADWKNPETLAFATMKTAPRSVRPFNDLAGYYVLHNRIPEAKKYYQKALRITPSIVAMNNLGYIYAMSDLDANIRTLNQPYESMLQLGQEAMQKKQPRQALYYYNEIYTPESHDIVLVNNIAAAFLEAGVYDKAEKYLEISMKYNTSMPDTYFLYGYLAFKKGDLNKAVDYLNTVLKLDPNHAGARANLEYVKQQLGATPPNSSPPFPEQK